MKKVKRIKAPWTRTAGGLKPAGASAAERTKKLRRLYLKLKRDFLRGYPSFELHHMRGRNGTLLIDERFWLMVLPTVHRRIHDYPEMARKEKLLCQPGQWNRAPDDAETRRLKKLIEDL